MSSPQPDAIKNRQWLLIWACAAGVALPLAWRGNSCGHDFDFHLQSWLAVAEQWQHGGFYPHWLDAANYLAGEPRFVFYPPFSWMLGALLGMLLSWSAAPIAFTLLILAAGGLSMNKLAKEWLPPNAAAIAACAYILNPYTLFVAYERTAYGELAAGIFLPLVIFFGLRLANAGAVPAGEALPNRVAVEPTHANAPDPDFGGRMHRRPSPGPRAIVSVALAIAAIWLTNAPAAVMSCYLLAMIVLWTAIASRQWQPLVYSAISVVLGLGLASFYLVPAAWERRWVDIARAIGPGMRIEDSFLFGHTGESYHDQVLRVASLIFVTMAVTILAAAAIAWKRGISLRRLSPLLVIVVVLFALQLPWSASVWNHAPELKFLQFPWRWSLVLSIAFAISLAAAFRGRGERRREFAVHAVLILAVAAAIVPVASRLFWQPCDEEDAVAAQIGLTQGGFGFEGTDEYTPLGADNSLILQNMPPVRVLKTANAETAAPTSQNRDDGEAKPLYASSPKDEQPARVQVDQWLPEKKIFTVTAQSPGYAVLRLMDYPVWQVRLNQALFTDRPHRDDGLMAIPIQPGLTRIEIHYSATPDAIWGRALSTASLLALLALAAAARKPLS